jgi:hypothetical protein
MKWSHSALEEKKLELEKKLGRSLATRIVFSTEDSKFLESLVREITFSIEVTTVRYLVSKLPLITHMHGIPVQHDSEE